MSNKNKSPRGGIVYSTDPNFRPEEPDEELAESRLPAQQDLRIRLDRLKGNKVATVVYQFKGNQDALEALAKALKNKCACGGAAKEGQIMLQGDFREKVKAELSRLGYKWKQVGG